jgi:undecaprenyl-diphosphatase
MSRGWTGTRLLCSTVALALVARRVARRRTADADRAWLARIGTGWGGADLIARLAQPHSIVIETLVLACLPQLHPRERAAIALTPLLAGLAGHTLKLSLPRDRPGKARFSPQGDQSFPSTHAAHATALAFAAASVARRRGHRWGLSAAAIWAGAIGLARLRAIAHWPSDVVAGWLLGLAATDGARLLVGLA